MEVTGTARLILSRSESVLIASCQPTTFSYECRPSYVQLPLPGHPLYLEQHWPVILTSATSHQHFHLKTSYQTFGVAFDCQFRQVIIILQICYSKAMLQKLRSILPFQTYSPRIPGHLPLQSRCSISVPV